MFGGGGGAGARVLVGGGAGGGVGGGFGLGLGSLLFKLPPFPAQVVILGVLSIFDCSIGCASRCQLFAIHAECLFSALQLLLLGVFFIGGNFWIVVRDVEELRFGGEFVLRNRLMPVVVGDVDGVARTAVALLLFELHLEVSGWSVGVVAVADDPASEIRKLFL